MLIGLLIYVALNLYLATIVLLRHPDVFAAVKDHPFVWASILAVITLPVVVYSLIKNRGIQQ